jgi:hypothetical protein
VGITVPVISASVRVPSVCGGLGGGVAYCGDDDEEDEVGLYW